MASVLSKRFSKNMRTFQKGHLFSNFKLLSSVPHMSKMSTAQILDTRRQRSHLCSETELKEFKALFPTVVKDLTTIPALMPITDTNKWMEQVYDYGIRQENTLWAEQMILANRMLSSNKHSTSWKTLVHIYACSLHLNCVGNLMVDEIVTHSETDFGREGSCNLSGDKHISMCDSILVTNSCSLLLKKYFGNLDFYTDLLKLRSEMMYSIPFGRHLALVHRKDFRNFNTEIFNKITRFSTALPGFFEPVAAIMIMNGCKETTLLNHAKAISVEIGCLHNMYVDFSDFCNNTKEYTQNIQDGDPTWMLAEAMENSSNAQRTILLENYGQKNEKSVAKVQEVFAELDLETRFQRRKDDTAEIVHTIADKLTEVQLQKYYETLWSGLF
ncbi:unnamed protein product [Allacma fusca]|uniref:Uncharacterized protein n=1 Tax=Allacma fusca TaxID=39272 RepID=A0A8J2NTY4_9HEXA|nr:unnamed protein product [Allacma fusca]